MPPADLLPGHSHRATPYLYSDADIAALMAAARELRSLLRAATFETLVGLLAVSGLRIGEALRLDRDDVDLVEGVLAVRLTKFGKSREVPVHASTTDAFPLTSELRSTQTCVERTRTPAGTPIMLVMSSNVVCSYDGRPGTCKTTVVMRTGIVSGHADDVSAPLRSRVSAPARKTLTALGNAAGL